MSHPFISHKCACPEPTSTPTLPRLQLGCLSPVQSPPSTPSTLIGCAAKLARTHQQETSSPRIELNRDLIERKAISDPSTIDTSRFCRFFFPDGTTAVILAANETITMQRAINRLFAKRGITWYRTELFSSEQVRGSPLRVDLQEPLSNWCGREIHVQSRILLRIDFPAKTICVRCDPTRTLLQILQPIFDKFKYPLRQYIFYANDSLIPLNVNELVGCYDNQRIFSVDRTAASADLTNRQKTRTPHDIFEMIPENDEDIKFDECGILKVVSHSKATFVVTHDDYLQSSTSDALPTVFECSNRNVSTSKR